MNLAAIRAHWLRLCANCDAGIGASCTCPSDDHRPVIQMLCDEVERLTALVAQLDAAHEESAGELATANEQLAAATLEGQP